MNSGIALTRLVLGTCAALLVGNLHTESNVTKTSSASSSNVAPVDRTTETGTASYYAEKYNGRLTASGEVFDNGKLTAAHRSLPFGTQVKVTHLGNHHSVMVRVNDRGPFVAGRVIDLSRVAAEELQIIQSGLAEVRVEILK